MHPLVNVAVQAAREASNILLRSMDQLETLAINEKGRNDYATEVDRMSEQVIIETIREKYPNHSILAEESGESVTDDDTCWIIDPLDGTTNFIHGLPHFCISIAARVKGRMEAGVIYDPLRQELFVASRGEGARLNDRRIRVSARKKLEGALLGTGFPVRQLQHFKPYLNTFINIFPKSSGIRRAGSAALDLAYVACGRLDGYWEAGLKPWDIAAGTLLVKEAGGLIGDYNGSEKFLESGNVIAGNPKVFKGLTETIHKALHD